MFCRLVRDHAKKTVNFHAYLAAILTNQTVFRVLEDILYALQQEKEFANK